MKYDIENEKVTRVGESRKEHVRYRGVNTKLWMQKGWAGLLARKTEEHAWQKQRQVHCGEPSTRPWRPADLLHL